MSKLKELSHESGILSARENSPGTGGVPCLTGSGARFPRDFGQE